jgi:hypothetical protein
MRDEGSKKQEAGGLITISGFLSEHDGKFLPPASCFLPPASFIPHP